MSTSICQGLQSCLQPGVMEPRVLQHKFALPNSNLALSTPWNKPDKLEGQDHHPNDDINEFHDVNKKKVKKGVDKNDNNDDMMKNNGLSFLQALTAKNDTGTEYVYVHPMVKRLASMLSAKSLEMCTESLGSETGSDTGDSSGDEMSMLSEAVTATATVTARQSPRAREVVLSPPKRLSRSGSFPPPLTSVSGSAGFHVRPHREDGRLVLKAVAVSSSSGLFHAERADGRLTLRLMNNFNTKNEEEEEEDEEEKVESEIESEEEAYEEEDDDEEENGEEEETEEVKMEAEMIQRPSRCKEDGHGNNNVLMNWEPFLVAT